jgi:hypothetical protein
MKSRSCTERPQEVQLHVASRSQLPGGTTWGTVLAKDPAEGAQLLDGHGMSWSLDWFKGKITGNHGFYHQI